MFQFVIRNSSLVILLLGLISWGCQKKSAVVAPPPQVTPAPQPKSAPSPPASTVQTPPNPVPPEAVSPSKTKTATSRLEAGETYFKAGNYRQAIQSLEGFIRDNPKSSRRNQALFYLGLSRALANDSSRDLTKAETAFKRLITEFPKSQYRSQVEFILGLQAQIERLKSDVKERDDRIKQLSDELRRLKEIDLQRRPSRPPD
jgi:TolA-binding protein